jgi:hypothetical protein
LDPLISIIGRIVVIDKLGIFREWTIDAAPRVLYGVGAEFLNGTAIEIVLFCVVQVLKMIGGSVLLQIQDLECTILCEAWSETSKRMSECTNETRDC